MRNEDSSTVKRYRGLLAQQERERLSVEAVAARAGVKASTLTWWKSELKRRARERGEAEAKVEAKTLVPVTIREVEPAAIVTSATLPIAYEVVLGGGRVLRVPRGFEAAEVRALVRALETVPC